MLRRSASVDWDLGMDRGHTHDFYVPHNRTIDVDWTLTEPAYSEPPPQPEVIWGTLKLTLVVVAAVVVVLTHSAFDQLMLISSSFYLLLKIC